MTGILKRKGKFSNKYTQEDTSAYLRDRDWNNAAASQETPGLEATIRSQEEAREDPTHSPSTC